MAKTIYTFPGSVSAELSAVGGKGLSLIVASEAGLPVPPGFVLSVTFFEAWMSTLKTTDAWTRFQHAKDDALEQACDALKSGAMRFALTQEQEWELAKQLASYES